VSHDPLADVVALVAAAGKGQRIAPLPCSKELFPVGFRKDAQSGELRPKVASHYLLEKFRHAGITNTYVIVREGKWDIPAYFGDGGLVGLHMAYLVVTHSIGPPDTLDRAYPFVRDKRVAFGFPDILFGPDDVYHQLIEQQQTTGAEVVLGLYPAHDVSQMDMVEVNGSGRIRSMILKPPSSALEYTWICAVWTAGFTRFMHAFLASERSTPDPERQAYADIDSQGDLPLGAVFKAAVEDGRHVHGLTFPGERYIDIGTAGNLIEAVRRSTCP
jgi:dTDP-glucose pyrophosphorylase